MQKVKYMKNLLLLLFIPTTISSGHNPNFNPNIKESRTIIEKVVDIKPQPISSPQPVGELVTALIYVESRGVDSAVGDASLGEPSIGVLQIRPIMIREVNRILKLKRSKIRFKRKDRFSREKSIEMFLIWKEFHHKDSDFETIARNWNGGPKGYKRSSTLHYWNKVEIELNK
jgi:hypothetical protein|tara:strand:+ start:2648 stop:3163 length:516 start_codon:yes stop_codon:yes gene_type:complete